MAFNNIISKLFGNKAQRDLKEVNPTVKKVKEAYTEIEKLSNDELRNRTKELEKQISEYVSGEKDQISQLKADMVNIELNEREAIWTQIDKLEKDITEKY